MQSSIDLWRSIHGGAFEGVKTLVTGGAGFIGSHIASALAHLGATVVALDDLSGGGDGDFHGLGPIEFVRGSILDKPLLARCMQGARYVFHQAALGSVPGSVKEPVRYFEVNVTGTINVLEAARAAGTQRLLFAASASAYGSSEVLPKVESMAPEPISPYAASKVAGEAFLRAYSASYPTLDTAALRYFNIFGPRQNANSAYAAAIAAFATAVLAGRRPTIFGDGEQSRDFTHVDNVVHANLLAARAQRPLRGETINVAVGQRVSVNELVREIIEFRNRSDLSPIHAPQRAGDVRHSLADISRARELLGYEPIVDFRTGLTNTLQWYADQSPHAAQDRSPS
ncbi:MAG TPA: NAD-dependent epimerase/dehydratase family protein [Tepidisphaeraceae bacterium]|nr:NAD-dependent epimerase/dehydratase family protein [Tepidisphaeraceae bacterium]